MALATGYQLILQPQHVLGEVTRVVAVLTGGTQLDAPLTVRITGGFVSSSPSGFAEMTIAPGEYAGSVTFPVAGGGGQPLQVGHTGGNTGMVDPSGIVPGFIGTGYVPVSGIALTHLDVPAGTQPTWTATTSRLPSGKGHLIGVTLVGDTLAGPLVLTPSDGAGGRFLPDRIEWKQEFEPRHRYFSMLYYFPASAGAKTVTVTASGVPGGLSSSLMFDANL